MAVAGLAVLAVIAAPFLATPDSGRTAAVSMEQARTTGVPESAVLQAERSAVVIPIGQVRFSQYKFVVGYYGVTELVAGLQANTERELGEPLSVRVSDFSGANLSVRPDGLLRRGDGEGSAATEWVSAQDAYFVVDSDARVPTRDDAIVPFSDRGDAAAFADAHGGRVVQWAAARQADVGATDRTTEEWQRTADRRQARADAVAARSKALVDRPVSETVSPNESVAAAVRDAPPNSTVVLAAGNHPVSGLRVEKPLTILGQGANESRLAGDGNGSVVYAESPGVALANLSIAGVGSTRSGDPENTTGVPGDVASFREKYWSVHGYGDAGVVFNRSNGSLVRNVRIHTEANGVIARNSPNATVSNLTVVGTEDWEDGFLGVSVLGAPVVVEDSTFYGGKVGVFAHDTSSFAVRNATMKGMMVGVFSVFAQGAYVSESAVEDTWVGVYVHDRSDRNVVANNTVRNSRTGVLVYGRSSYVAGNVLTHNDYGVAIQGQYSLYRRNVAVRNDAGIRVMSLFPTNRVTANDFAGNRRYAETARFNVRHVWRGNYWRGAPGVDADGDGRLARPFYVTGPVGEVAERGAGAPTLARAPALELLYELQGTVPGLRFGGVVDTRPRADPVRPDVVAAARNDTREPGRYEDDDRWDYAP